MNIEDKIENYLKLDEAFKEGYDNLSNLEISEQKIHLSESQKQQLNESISVTLIISLILGTPSIIKNLTKAIGFLYKKIKKLLGKKEKSSAIESLLKFTEKWHHLYINILRKILQMAGIFKSAGMKDEKKQQKATEVVFYTIIFGFAIEGGIATTENIMHTLRHFSPTHIKIAALKSILTSIKSREVSNFIKTIAKG